MYQGKKQIRWEKLFFTISMVGAGLCAFQSILPVFFERAEIINKIRVVCLYTGIPAAVLGGLGGVLFPILFPNRRGSRYDRAEDSIDTFGMLMGSQMKSKMKNAINMGKQMEAASFDVIYKEIGVGIVKDIVKTGQMVHSNPVVRMTVEAIFNDRRHERIEITSIVDKAAVPRVGDTISIGDNPSMPGGYVYNGMK